MQWPELQCSGGHQWQVSSHNDCHSGGWAADICKWAEIQDRTGEGKEDIEDFVIDKDTDYYQSVEKTPDTDLSDIVSIGNKLSNYGTYLCNKTHSSPARHICSFLVCPARHTAQPYTIRHSISLTPVDTSSCLVSGKSRGNRKNRWASDSSFLFQNTKWGTFC